MTCTVVHMYTQFLPCTNNWDCGGTSSPSHEVLHMYTHNSYHAQINRVVKEPCPLHRNLCTCKHNSTSKWDCEGTLSLSHETLAHVHTILTMHMQIQNHYLICSHTVKYYNYTKVKLHFENYSFRIRKFNN